MASENAVATRMHVDHCIETLRLSIMCHSDVTPLLVERDSWRKTGFVLDFNNYHKCRNFERIVQYVDQKNYDIISPLPGGNPDS